MIISGPTNEKYGFSGITAGFSDKFFKVNAASDDASAFPNKSELLAQLQKTRATAIRWIKSLTEKDLDKPTDGPMKSFLRTVHHVLSVIADHTSMHKGQFQVIRRKLGKPVLFDPTGFLKIY